MARYCSTLQEARAAEHGNKAAHLAAVARLDVRVPPTCVVARSALRAFIEHNVLADAIRDCVAGVESRSAAEAVVAHEQLSAAATAAAWPIDVRDAIMQSAVPLFDAACCGLAVRSSATVEDTAHASCAGVFDSYLDVSDTASLLRRVIDCWCSLWAPRSVRYMARLGIEAPIDAMAVMIQPVLQAVCSGVTYTADPVSGNPWRCVTQAVRGLSVDLMGGGGIGERFVSDWTATSIIEYESGTADHILEATPAGVVSRASPRMDERPVLSDDAVFEITRVAQRLDQAQGLRLDMEWAFVADELYVVQARPMTALPEFFPVELTKKQRSRTWQPAMFSLPLRSDVPPHFLTPLYGDLDESELWHRYQPAGFVLTGVWTEAIVCNGYRYCPAEPFPTFLEHFASPADYEPWLSVHEAPYRVRWDRRVESLTALASDARSAIESTMTAAELIPTMFQVRDRLWDMASFGWSGPQALGWMCEGALNHALGEWGLEAASPDLISGGAESYTFLVTRDLQVLGRTIDEQAVHEAFADRDIGAVLPYLLEHHAESHFLARLEQLCRRYGKNPPTWFTRAAVFGGPAVNDVQMMHSIKSAMNGSARCVMAVQQDARARRRSAEQDVRACVSSHGPGAVQRFDRLLEWTRYWTQALNDRHGLGAGWLWERDIIWQTGVRLCDAGLCAAPEDILLCTRGDLESWCTTGDDAQLHARLAHNRRAWQRHRRLAPPATLGAPPPALDPVASPPECMGNEADTWHGQGGGGGVVMGRARRIENLSDPALFDTLTARDILVFPQHMIPYADWHSLLMVVKGVVCAGRLSHHLAQVARECGVPIISMVTGDLTGIEDSTPLRIDGRSGLVSRSE